MRFIQEEDKPTPQSIVQAGSAALKQEQQKNKEEKQRKRLENSIAWKRHLLNLEKEKRKRQQLDWQISQSKKNRAREAEKERRARKTRNEITDKTPGGTATRNLVQNFVDAGQDIGSRVGAFMKDAKKYKQQRNKENRAKLVADKNSQEGAQGGGSSTSSSPSSNRPPLSATSRRTSPQSARTPLSATSRRGSSRSSSDYNPEGYLKKGYPVFGGAKSSASSTSQGSPTRTQMDLQRRSRRRMPVVKQINLARSRGQQMVNTFNRMVNRYNRTSGNVQEMYGTDEFSAYLEESYCCWREEFLVELGPMRKERKKTKKKVIDVMRGKNCITVMPRDNEGVNEKYMYETTNGASIFAKATPPLKKRTTPMSDIYLAKQPGKASTEKVRDVMAKLFLGNTKGYTDEYDLSGHKADDNKLDSAKVNSEAYGDDDYRMMSNQFSVTNNLDDAHQRRKVRALKAFSALNTPIATPKKKKKKKKKKEAES